VQSASAPTTLRNSRLVLRHRRWRPYLQCLVAAGERSFVGAILVWSCPHSCGSVRACVHAWHRPSKRVCAQYCRQTCSVRNPDSHALTASVKGPSSASNCDSTLFELPNAAPGISGVRCLFVLKEIVQMTEDQLAENRAQTDVQGSVRHIHCSVYVKIRFSS
jgi:hypothetical protein